MDNGIGSRITIHSRRRPDRVALVDGESGAEFTYAELEARTNALADALRAKGVRNGDRVALVALNSPHFLEVIFAVQKLGAIAVPANYRLVAPEIRYILDDSAACMVFASTQVLDTVREAAEGTHVREIIEIPSAQTRGPSSEYEALIAAGDPARVEVDIAHDDLSMIMYTSGTTGFPKGAMLTHGNHLWNAANNMTCDDGLIRQDTTLVVAPLFHIGAFGIFTAPLLYLGGTSVIYETFDPQSWLNAVEEYRPAVAFCVPSMWGSIIACGLQDRDLSSLRYVFSGGAPCPLVCIDEFVRRDVPFTEGFGMTEAAPFVSILAPGDVMAKAGSVGKPVTHVDVRIVDDRGDEVAIGETGEMLVRGPNIFVGYWQKPEATASALQSGWYHTGDLATCDEDGFYSIIDRKKDMVISGGENVYPAEVEQALYQNPKIAEVAVIGTPHEHWGEMVTAVVVLKPGADLTADELEAWARERLSAFKCPRRIEFVDELPHTATGKVLKREIRKRWTFDGAAVTR
ncbi:acyl-CoA synthetase [Gordonia sp. (in: high G+C Gram-positive bacteria)]|uniref:acyl-CoA synthetase n=1 Tax=Gordonia sp. (in: high G+C Gram-positive bacteria) TaxID=84139 RepID=UPI003C7620B4